MEKLPEAAEKYARERSITDTREDIFIAGFNYSKEVIEELVKALEAITWYDDGKARRIAEEALTQHRNNEKQG